MTQLIENNLEANRITTLSLVCQDRPCINQFININGMETVDRREQNLEVKHFSIIAYSMR